MIDLFSEFGLERGSGNVSRRETVLSSVRLTGCQFGTPPTVFELESSFLAPPASSRAKIDINR